MPALVIHPLAGAGHFVRLAAFLRRLIPGRRLLLGLVGTETVVIAGCAYAVRPVPLGVARELVPAIVRCSRAFVRFEVTDEMYTDLIKALSLGLGVPAREIERHAVSLWDLAPVIDLIARVNGLQVMEAGDVGKLLALMTQTGTSSTPGSSAPPAGPGNTLTDA